MRGYAGLAKDAVHIEGSVYDKAHKLAAFFKSPTV